MHPRISRFDALTVSHHSLFAWLAAFAVLTCLAQYLARNPASRADSPVQLATDAVVVFGFAWSWLQITIRGARGRARGRWVAAIGAMMAGQPGFSAFQGHVSRLVCDFNRYADSDGVVPMASDGHAIPGNAGQRAARLTATIAAPCPP